MLGTAEVVGVEPDLPAGRELDGSRDLGQLLDQSQVQRRFVNRWNPAHLRRDPRVAPREDVTDPIEYLGWDPVEGHIGSGRVLVRAA